MIKDGICTCDFQMGEAGICGKPAVIQLDSMWHCQEHLDEVNAFCGPERECGCFHKRNDDGSKSDRLCDLHRWCKVKQSLDEQESAELMQRLANQGWTERTLHIYQRAWWCLHDWYRN